MTASSAGRIGLRKLLQRIGIVGESMTLLATDPAEVTQLLMPDGDGAVLPTSR